MSTEKTLKILAIVGSPKGKVGNGYKAIQNIEVEMDKLGPIEFTYLVLNKTDLKPCLGCFACVSRGENLCPLKDDRGKIEALIEAHDGIILSSPGYVQNISGLMKNFSDRFAYTHHRPKFFDKKVLLVANGGAGLDKTLSGLALAIGGPKVVAKLVVLAPPWPLKDNAKHKNEKNTQAAATKLYQSLKNNNLPAPTLTELLMFKFFKATSKECQTWLPADYEYYSKLEGYYYPTKVNPLKRGLAPVIVKLVTFLMRDMGPNEAGDSMKGAQEKQDPSEA
jgi:multimeric flavodoxin WrbA